MDATSALPDVTPIAQVPCNMTTIKTKKKTPWSNSESWTDACAIGHAYGLNTGDRIQLSDVSGSLTDYFNKPLVDVPQTNNMISSNYGTTGFNRLAINYNVINNLNISVSGGLSTPTGTITYQIKTPGAWIKDAAGNFMEMNMNVMAFSANGRYMVVDAPNVAMLRVDLQDGSIVPFAAPFVYSGTFIVPNSIAITNDGTTVAVRGQNHFRLYDLLTCGSVPSAITAPVSCESKDIQSFLDSQITDGQPARALQFLDNNNLMLYVRHGSPQVWSKYLLTSSGSGLITQQYLALGDSYSSGEGAMDYYAGTDVAENKCHLSTNSYAQKIITSLGYTSAHNVACSGAKSKNITTSAQYSTVPTPNPLGTWLPGMTAQNNKIALTQPNVVTVGIGGNDIGFAQKIRRCVASIPLNDTCYASYNERMQLIQEINNEYSTLISTYKSVKSATKPSAKIYTIGYPQIAKSGGNCGNNVHLNAEEISLSNQLVNHLNYVIQNAALAAGVAYIDVSNAFSGHKLCETSQSNIAMNGLTYGQETANVIGNESFHPNQLGNLLIKNAILSTTNNFTTYNVGNPANTIAPTTNSATAQALLGPYTTPSYQTIKTSITTDQIPNTAYKSTGLNFILNQSDSHLKPSTSYTVELHSSPVSLGTFTTDSSGQLDVSATIPSSLPNGIHSLHIYGNDLGEQPVDVNQTIAIGSSPTDFDGDSVADSPSGCKVVANSGLDVDQDDIDDACDSNIGRSPTDIAGLYRARQGNPTNGESADNVYVERNVAKASSLLGLVDYDPDSDGWSLVGVGSSGQQGTYANISINDVGLTENSYDEYIPKVSLRTNSMGCIEIMPSNLSAVTITTSLALNTTATNTSACRSAADSADLDSNTIPDNLQSLYRYRQGNPTLGESGSDVFIERDKNAAEAILGISDYDDNADGWSKVASSSNTSGNYIKIGLYDPATNTVLNDGSTNLTSAQLSTYPTKVRRQQFIPVIAIQDGIFCKNYVPSDLGYVGIAQSRGFAEQINNILTCF
jgi:hypothetical protein